jgi:hypothetical protein
MGIEAISLGIKQPVREANNLHPSCTKVKNGGDITQHPNMFSWHSN